MKQIWFETRVVPRGEEVQKNGDWICRTIKKQSPYFVLSDKLQALWLLSEGCIKRAILLLDEWQILCARLLVSDATGTCIAVPTLQTLLASISVFCSVTHSERYFHLQSVLWLSWLYCLLSYIYHHTGLPVKSSIALCTRGINTARISFKGILAVHFYVCL